MDRQIDCRQISCSLCLSSGLRLNLKICDYIKYLRLFHAHHVDFKFTCGIDGCVRSYNNIGTFKNHVSAVHYGSPASNSPTENLANSSEVCTDDTLSIAEPCASNSNDEEDVGDMVGEDVSLPPQLSDQCVLQKSSALFLLGLKEKHKLTQVAIPDIVENVTNLTQQRLSIVKHQVYIHTV